MRASLKPECGGAGGIWTRVRNTYILGPTCLVCHLINLFKLRQTGFIKASPISFNTLAPDEAAMRSCECDFPNLCQQAKHEWKGSKTGY